MARGGEPGDEGLRYLRAQGYRTVVSFLADGAESAQVVQSGMHYVHIPIQSSFFGSDVPTDSQVRQFLSVVGDSTRYPVFIHCHAGKDRTGAMSAIYRMEMCGWNADEAVDEMRAFGFSSRYRNLRRFVEGYSVSSKVASSKPSVEPSSSSASVLHSAPADSAIVKAE